MSQDYVELLVWKILKQFSWKVKKIFQKTPNQNIDEQSTVCVNEQKRESCDATAGGSDAISSESNNSIDSMYTEFGSEQTAETLESDSDVPLQPSEGVKEPNEDDDEKETDKEDPKSESRSRQKTESDIPTINKVETKSAIETALHFHFILFLLWLMVTCTCIPSVLTWAQNFR